jgi:thioredoxin 1
MGGELVSLTNRHELKTYLKKKEVVIVKVSATWCGPCKRITPQVNTLYSQLNSHVSMVLVDADEGSDICNYLKVKTVPHLINYVDGMPFDILTSSKNEDVFAFFKSTHERSLIYFNNSLETNHY